MPQGAKTASRVAVEERRNGSLFTWAVELLLETLELTAACGGGGEPRLAGAGSRCPENECSWVPGSCLSGFTLCRVTREVKKRAARLPLRCKGCAPRFADGLLALPMRILRSKSLFFCYCEIGAVPAAGDAAALSEPPIAALGSRIVDEKRQSDEDNPPTV